MSSGLVSKLNQKVYAQIEMWRNRKLEGRYPYLYLDGVLLKRSSGGEVRNLSVLVGDRRGRRRLSLNPWCRRRNPLPEEAAV